MENKFKSKNRNGIWYVIGMDNGNHSYFYSNCNGYISPNVFEFNDLNDNGTQHTPLTLSNSDYLIDFMDSFIIYLNNGNDWPEELSLFRYMQDTKLELIKTFKLKEGKKLYYSFDTGKISYNDKYQYDKRYEILYDTFQHTGDHYFRLISERYYSALENAFLIHKLYYIDDLYNVAPLFKDILNVDYDKSRIHSKLSIILNFYKIMECKKAIKNSIEYLERVEN